MPALDHSKPPRQCKGCARQIRWGDAENTWQELGCYDCEARRRASGQKITAPAGHGAKRRRYAA